MCGGYDRNRIFVNQTSKADTSILARSSPSQNSVEWKERVSLRSSITLPDDLTRSAYREKSVEAFFNMYIPDGGAHGSTAEILRTNSFVSVLPLLYVRDEALRLALLAVGTAAMGKVTGD